MWTVRAVKLVPGVLEAVTTLAQGASPSFVEVSPNGEKVVSDVLRWSGIHNRWPVSLLKRWILSGLMVRSTV